jgi:maleylpyruvate isomerase
MRQQDIDRAVLGCTQAHRRLVDHLDGLLRAGALNPSSPSLLPNWSVAHVLVHLAANADSHVRVFDGAARGEVLDQYAGGFAARNAAIEEGVGKDAAQLVGEIGDSCARLEQAWAVAAERGWEGRWRSPLGPELAVTELPFRRWRETEVHHADLGLDGFGFDDWSPEYVKRELALRTIEWSSRQPMGMTSLPKVALQLSTTTRLAWLMGRVVPAGLEPVTFG